MNEEDFAYLEIKISDKSIKKKLNINSIDDIETVGIVKLNVRNRTASSVYVNSGQTWTLGKVTKTKETGVKDVCTKEYTSIQDKFRSLYGELQNASQQIIKAKLVDLSSITRFDPNDNVRLICEIDRLINLHFPAMQEMDDRDAYREATMAVHNYDKEESRKFKKTLKKSRDNGIVVMSDIESRRSKDWCIQHTWKPKTSSRKRTRRMTWDLFLSPYKQEILEACEVLGIEIMLECPDSAVECIKELNSLFRKKALTHHPDKIKDNGAMFSRLNNAKAKIISHIFN